MSINENKTGRMFFDTAFQCNVRLQVATLSPGACKPFHTVVNLYWYFSVTNQQKAFCDLNSHVVVVCS